MQLTNEMILASAGSGKTWQLTNRYIALMALQLRSGQPVAPERILAVTFTRKAAGEFFDKILEKLALAASDPKQAAALAGDGSDPLAAVLATLAPADYAHLLRVFLSQMPRLFLGTLDSFFANLLRAFPAEFGLASGFETMDDFESAASRARVYDTIFSRSAASGTGEDAAQGAFLEAFRLATLGADENHVARQLDSYIDDLHDLYLRAPSPARWGNPDAIWPDGGRHWFGGEIDPAAEGECLLKALRSMEDGGSKIEWKYWDEFVADLPSHQPGLPLGGRLKYVAERALPVWRDVVSGGAQIKFNRTVHDLGPAACEPLRRIFQWIVGGELRLKLSRTRGVGDLLRQYETAYARQVRRRGLLTFHDVQLILAAREPDDGVAMPVFTQSPDEDARLRIDYRLDARYDHWLLDEFQDTSPLQWKVIENLVDEVVQDTSGTRSLFQVGDLKQAIYAWRGGDTRLFSDIAARYNANEERLQRRHLDISWRSGHDVIDPVNRVFGDRAALAALELPTAALDQWEWHDHRVSPKGETYEGITCLLNPVAPSGEKPEAEDIHDLVAGILREIDPVRRGIACAILVQKNASAEELVDALRARTDIPVVSESEIFIADDNPLCRALVSLFKIAAHPGDRFACEHLRMGPVGRIVEREDLSQNAFSARILASVFESDFESVARDWIARIESTLEAPLDAFTRGRAEEFTLAARLFDETGSRDIDEFLAWLKSYRTREAVAGNAVQVMTVHKSKGLTFDAVILPELGGNSLDTARTGIGAKQNADREIEWVLEMPRKDFVAADPVLADYAAERTAEAAYENLCKYYVALTRASRANYLITEPRGSSATSRNFVKLLEDVLAEEPQETTFGGVPATVLFASRTGKTNRHWFEAFSPPEAKEEAPDSDAPSGAAPSTARFRPRRRTPSGTEDYTISAAQIFSRQGGDAREFGTLVHAIFEGIEWSDDLDLDALEADWRSHRPDSASLADALEQVRGVLAEPGLRAALAHPDGNAEVWRERNFEIVLGDEWLSGTFDRVVIERDDAGQAIAATILDFKTDRISDEDLDATVAKYQPQLETYRRVLARMIRLPEASIRCRLIFTRPRQLRSF
ncbi:MAG TPA: UvrD-helicase domain-containing protein [Bacteroidia bacterium]|nr:UvrD-helicase domain-containing protein [Bacteroidia bacterium]